ncbi:MAG: hypothetical protein JWP91_1809 [Fibrobacteres bacterium]|nr:hypothetical protein [Fibrobacterota bacterium]
MNKFIAILAMVTVAATASVKAAPGSALVEEQYKAALSHVTQEVAQAKDPQEKRQILGHFINGMKDGLQKAEGLESISEADRASLHAVTGKFFAYDAELNGLAGYDRVADADLNAFAGYVQQSMEQAPISGGGVYISGGALIVVLLLLIFLL